MRDRIGDLLNAIGVTFIVLLLVAMVVGRLQTAGYITIETPSLVADQDSGSHLENAKICGTIEMPGLSIDECSETYTILSESEFIITNGAGEKVLLSGPLVIKCQTELNKCR